MSIVQLDLVQISKLLEVVVVVLLVSSDNIIKRSGAEEELLLESQLFASICGIIWIQNTCDVLCTLSLLDGTNIIRLIES